MNLDSQPLRYMTSPMEAEQGGPTKSGHNLGIRPQKAATARQHQFAQLVATGVSQAEAYRRVFNPGLKAAVAAARGYRTSCLPWVSREIERFRAKSEAKKLLSYNDRLEILAKIAQNPDAKHTDQVSAVMGYSKLAGDQPPDESVVTVKNPEGAAFAVSVTHVTKAQKIAALEAARTARQTALPA